MLLEVLLAWADEFAGDELVASLLESGHDVADESSLDAIWLDCNEAAVVSILLVQRAWWSSFTGYTYVCSVDILTVVWSCWGLCIVCIGFAVVRGLKVGRSCCVFKYFCARRWTTPLKSFRGVFGRLQALESDWQAYRPLQKSQSLVDFSVPSTLGTAKVYTVVISYLTWRSDSEVHLTLSTFSKDGTKLKAARVAAILLVLSIFLCIHTGW